MTDKINLDLDAIEAAAKAAGAELPSAWYTRKEEALLSAMMSPAAVLELVRRLRAAEALAASRIEQIPVDAKVVSVFADIVPEHQAEAEEFAEAIKKRCTSGRWTLVAFFPLGADIQALDKEQMRQAGWVRAPQEVEGKASVDADALRQVLQALIGQPHYIRELQVCRGLPGSPIDKLVAEFNARAGSA